MRNTVLGGAGVGSKLTAEPDQTLAAKVVHTLTGQLLTRLAMRAFTG